MHYESREQIMLYYGDYSLFTLSVRFCLSDSDFSISQTNRIGKKFENGIGIGAV